MSRLNSPYMQAIRRPDDTHEGRPVFDVISRRQRIVLAKVFWYRPWKRFCWLWRIICARWVSSLTSVNRNPQKRRRGPGTRKEVPYLWGESAHKNR